MTAMPFNVDHWKQSTKEKLQGWKGRMERAGVNSAYYFLAGVSLLPVAQAVNSGDWSGLTVLGASLGGAVSTNLLANIVQKVKDKDEAEAAQILEAEAGASPELTAEIDVMLTKLDALAEAEKALSQADKAWFAELIQRELKQLNSGIKYEAKVIGDGAIAQGDGATAVGAGGMYIGGDVKNSTIMQGDHNRKIEAGTYIEKLELIIQNAIRKSLPYPEALAQYLHNIIATHKTLRLQGIRAGSQPLSISLEKVYVSLSAQDKRAGESTTTSEFERNSGHLSIEAALRHYQRLVIIGDPGCGKTTLISYLGLTYARTLADERNWVQERLGLHEKSHLPIILPLRDFGHHLKEKHPKPGKDGPALLLDYLREYYEAQHIPLPEDFFVSHLENGRAVLLLDGMDEVAEVSLRQRVARLIEAFAGRYEKCRYVVTSREVGYEGASRIGAGFGLAKVREFTPQEVRQFLQDWTRVVEATLAGSDLPEVLRLADEQSEKLIKAIDSNPRVADLAVNPLLLTVVALVHRYRAQLPERRSELYEEAVEVLLGHWDAAKNMDTEFTLPGGRKLDGGDRRSLLEPVAFWLHENRIRELERDDLRGILLPKFINMMGGEKEQASKSLDAFLELINERSGLLVERGVGVYGFAHLTFQEYLAARVLAERDDSLTYSLNVLPDPWWREVLLLEAGYLSNQGTRRVSTLIQAIMDADSKTEPEPHHHLLLAAECLFDVGAARVEGNLLSEAQKRLKKQADAPFKKGDKAAVLAKITASNALARIESKQVATNFWKLPHGEPQWVTIPAGKFWMGEQAELHQVELPEYQISRVPITNAQYAYYVKDTGVDAPEHWRGGNVPAGLDNHPVVNVDWYDALNYCKWLSGKIQKTVTLPSEAEWEKAARGDRDKRAYPWGDDWRDLHCNSSELGLNDTTPVGLFLNGRSLYGALDMSGNVWEWTRTNYHTRKDDLTSKDPRVLRGGSFNYASDDARCAVRDWNFPDSWLGYLGFRVVVSPVLPS
jgi:formylglycine-generating enzyme required for sulfatase activity